MMNNANAPFPNGNPVTFFTSNIMKFLTTPAPTTTTTGTYTGYTSPYFTTYTYTYTPTTTTAYNAKIGNIVNPATTIYPTFPASPLL